MTVDGFFNSNPARQMRLAMSDGTAMQHAWLYGGCKIKPRMHANRHELLLQRDVYAVVGCVIEVLNVRGHGYCPKAVNFNSRPYSRLFAACPPWRVHSRLVSADLSG